MEKLEQSVLLTWKNEKKPTDETVGKYQIRKKTKTSTITNSLSRRIDETYK